MPEPTWRRHIRPSELKEMFEKIGASCKIEKPRPTKATLTCRVGSTEISLELWEEYPDEYEIHAIKITNPQAEVKVPLLLVEEQRVGVEESTLIIDIEPPLYEGKAVEARIKKNGKFSIVVA